MTLRRTVIAGLALAPFALQSTPRAQPARKVYRIGILGNSYVVGMGGPEPRYPSINALVRGLRELGYVYGEHFVTEARGSEGRPERFPALAAELVRLRVDVIVAVGPALPALKQATSTIPIVMSASADPVALGYVQSLGRPGGNMTGLSLQSIETTGKRLELLKDLVPGAASVAMLWDRAGLAYRQAAEAAARERAWKLLPLEIRHIGELEALLRAATDARAGGLLVSGSGIVFAHRQRVAAQVADSRLPAMYELRPYVEAGGLMSYGADIDDIWRRAAAFVDKILKGARPTDLPVEQPTKFELVINLMAAKALGLAIPQALRVRADELIE